MAKVSPTDNYFYRQQSRIRSELISTLSYYQDTGSILWVAAHHLRYIFLVTYAFLDFPPYPADQMAKIRSFLADSYENPQRVIKLNGQQMREILEGIRSYRIYNRDNYHIVMRHLTYPEEECGFIDNVINDTKQEAEILEKVLALIPDAQPTETE